MKKQDPRSEKHCEECGRPLFGRTDKRFCNDTCRNAFNRKKTAGAFVVYHENMAEIFKILQNNYEILQSLGPIEPEGYANVTVERLVTAGFDFNFCTSIYQERDELWRFCFDRGWFLLDDEICVIRDRDEQVTTNDPNQRLGLKFK